MALAKSLTSTCTGGLALLLAILLFMALTMSSLKSKDVILECIVTLGMCYQIYNWYCHWVHGQLKLDCAICYAFGYTIGYSIVYAIGHAIGYTIGFAISYAIIYAIGYGIDNAVDFVINLKAEYCYYNCYSTIFVSAFDY